MTTKTLISGSACMVALLMAGCGGKILYPHYYALDIPAAPKPAASDARLPATLAVRRFEALPYLRQGRIVYRQGPAEIGFYDYHRWAADPAATVTAAVIDSLRSSRLFSFVRPYDGQGQHDYLLSGRIEGWKKSIPQAVSGWKPSYPPICSICEPPPPCGLARRMRLWEWKPAM